MSYKQLTIRITNETVYFSPEFSLPLDDTDLPWRDMQFNERRNIYWKVEQLGLSDDGVTLHLKVNYFADQADDYFHRSEPKRMFAKVSFGKLDWKELYPLLMSYHPLGLRDHVYNLPEPWALPSPLYGILDPDHYSYESAVPVQRSSSFSVAIKIRWEEITIGDGRAFFKRHVTDRGYSDNVEITILNAHLKPEFDLIKQWLAKRIGAKIQVEVKYITSATKITGAEATSKQIEAITPELIEGIKSQRTKVLLREPILRDPVKSIFDLDELFDNYDNEEKVGNVLKLTDAELLNRLFDLKRVRNQRQLEYLSKEKQSSANKIKYTLAPQFGFVFFTSGKSNDYFVWELLNSHATYIWSFPKGFFSIEEQYLKVEAAINSIRGFGREAYKQNFKKKLVDTDLAFAVISHKQTSLESSEGFPKWQEKLNAIFAN